MTMDHVTDYLDALVDGELPPDAEAQVRAHLATCAPCEAAYTARAEASSLRRASLMRYQTPDVLRARIRASIAAEPSPLTPAADHPAAPRGVPARGRRGLFAAALVLVAAMSSITTWTVARRGSAPTSLDELVIASHVRSLIPGHLTDVASNDQHNVKPWFNGRAVLSPPVARLDSIGFPLVGGRIDYLAGQMVPVSVYTRRKHVINVFALPSQAASGSAPRRSSEQGYHVVRVARDGMELWFVSDLNASELDTFVQRFEDATRE